MSRRPAVSIGIPIFNAGGYIGAAIEGLLAQTFGDFELIIGDNTSTDDSCDVVASYMLVDSRIQLVRQPMNIGANAIYSFVASRAVGTFFKWSSASDWCAPTFLERCREELLAHDDSVLAVPRTRGFSDKPEKSEPCSGDIALLENSPCARLKELQSNLGLNHVMNGLIRMSALKSTRLIESYKGADIVLMGHLALLGKFRLLDEALFYRRIAPETATSLQDSGNVWMHHYARRSAAVLFQASKRRLGWLRAALAARLSLQERVCVLTHLAKAYYWEGNVLSKDLQGVWRYFIRGG